MHAVRYVRSDNANANTSVHVVYITRLRDAATKKHNIDLVVSTRHSTRASMKKQNTALLLLAREGGERQTAFTKCAKARQPHMAWNLRLRERDTHPDED